VTDPVPAPTAGSVPEPDTGSSDDPVARLRQHRVLAILRDHTGGAHLAATADALVDAGIAVLEFTLDTPGAPSLIERFAGRSSVVVGAGTVRTPADVDLVAASGARFVVSPDLHPPVVERALALGLAPLPGVATPSEIRQAVDLGAPMVKLFPAGPLGAAYLRSLRAPFPDVPLVATGGIGPDDVDTFLTAGADAVALGGALAHAEPEEAARRAHAVLARIRAVADADGAHRSSRALDRPPPVDTPA